MEKSAHEENLSQTISTNIKQFQTAVTFLSGYNGIFNITTKTNKFYYTKTIDNDDYSEGIIRPGAYELENLREKFKRILLKNDILQKKLILFKSNQVFQLQVQLKKFAQIEKYKLVLLMMTVYETF